MPEAIPLSSPDIGAREIELVNQVLGTRWLSMGPMVERFEAAVAEYVGARHAVAVSSGTAGLHLAMIAAGLGPGDEVITTPFSFIASANCILYVGARPVFVDIDERTLNIDPDLVEAAITPRTRAIVPVHLFGQPADMHPILEVARRHGCFVVEDACQAHGAEYRGRPAGSLGDAGCFSFYPGKNLGAYGEAGAVVTPSEDLAARLRALRDHGQPAKHEHRFIGWNARMDGFQAAVLSVKLSHLAEANELRRRHAARYRALLDGIGDLVLPCEADYARHVYHLFAVRAGERDALMAHLGERGIGCGIHYPTPVHLQEAYRFLGHGQGSFPVAEQCAREFLSLPMFPELTEEQIVYVAQAVGEAVSTQEAMVAG